MTLTIHPDLHSLIPPLSADEYQQLEANLLAHGCRDALTVWQEEQILLDGHNRLEICERHGLTYAVHEVSLPALDAAKAWMIDNQLGRRNLTPDQISYFRGKQYEMQKQQGKRTDLTSHQSDGKLPNAVETLAAHHKVGTATIERDGAYARAIDTIAEAVGPEARQTLLAREARVGRQATQSLAALVTSDPQAADHVRAALQSAAPTESLRDMLMHAADNGRSSPVSTESTAPPLFTLEDAEAPEADASPEAVHRNRWGSLTEAHMPPVQRVYSGDCEWYTPPAFIALVREVLGTIDTDPASCDAAQAVVQARTFYTLEDDGLRHPWHGTVYLNPPYQMPDVARFSGKLLEELDAGHTTQAILLINSVTDTGSFHRIAPRAALVCFTDGRLEFWHPVRTPSHPSQGQAVLYFGPHVERFAEVFAAVGLIMQVYRARDAGPQLDLAAPTPAPETAGTIAEQMLAVLRDTPGGMSNAQLARAINKKQTDTFRPLERMVRRGTARKERTTYFSVAQKAAVSA
jgi:hypothetical protein